MADTPDPTVSNSTPLDSIDPYIIHAASCDYGYSTPHETFPCNCDVGERSRAALLAAIDEAAPKPHVNPSLHRLPYVEENYDNGFNDAHRQWQEAIHALFKGEQ